MTLGLAESAAEISLPGSSLDGCRVLLAEDEALIAFELQIIMRQAGCQVIGPVGTLAEGLALVETAALDAAVLDVKLWDGDVFPLADRLAERGIPFVLMSGYCAAELPERFRERPLYPKPSAADGLIAALNQALGRSSSLAMVA